MPEVIAGARTSTIYQCIEDLNYSQAISALTDLQRPGSRAVLSLSAYCHHHSGNFAAAAAAYATLIELFPKDISYVINHQHSLQQISRVPAVSSQSREGHNGGVSQPVGRRACKSYESGNYGASLQRFTDAAAACGDMPDLTYGRAVCCYRLGRLEDALSHVAGVIAMGLKSHPEFSDRPTHESPDRLPIESAQVLQDSCLVEAYNLRLAIELQLKDCQLARDAFVDMPRRPEADWDPVTLHNSALLHEWEDTNTGVNKLQHLLPCGPAPPYPPSTPSNLALLLCRAQRHVEASQLLSQYDGRQISQEVRNHVAAAALLKSAPEEGMALLEAQAAAGAVELGRLKSAAQSAGRGGNSEAVTTAMAASEAAVDTFMPVLMARVAVLWAASSYAAAGDVLEAAADVCFEHPTWRLNMAHAHFMTGRYTEALDLYESLVHENLLGVSAALLANLCVCKVLAGQNGEAEALMAALEVQESALKLQDPNVHVTHLSTTNLVVGTLYCAKGNFEFGIARVMKALQPCASKLDADTWFYAKRCLLALMDAVAKQLVVLPNSAAAEIAAFLKDVDAHGQALKGPCKTRGTHEEGMNPRVVRGNVFMTEARALRYVLEEREERHDSIVK